MTKQASDRRTRGYDTNKRHWNSVALDGLADGDELRVMIDGSYERVASKLRRAERVRVDRGLTGAATAGMIPATRKVGGRSRRAVMQRRTSE
jgi:hypothetical protein